MAPFTLVNGTKMDFEKVEVHRSGRMAASMSATGRMTKPIVKADWFMPMAMSMKGNGCKTKRMEEVSMNISMEPGTSEIGKRIDKMATELKPGRITQSTKALMKMVRSTASAHFNGQISQFT